MDTEAKRALMAEYMDAFERYQRLANMPKNSEAQHIVDPRCYPTPTAYAERMAKHAAEAFYTAELVRADIARCEAAS